ncbi:MAG: ABC transporter permease [Oscillospiraceae bacterium]|nr:ABC transporter permease [Oscillospiraceae bacterium]
MQVFKAFLKIAKKNLPMALLYVGLFLVLLTFFVDSNAKNNNFEAARLNVSVIDMDNTAASRALTEFIGQSHDLVEIENDKDEILDALYYGKSDYVLNIKEGYAEKISNGNTNGLFTNYKVPDSYTGVFVDNLVNQYVSTLSAYIAGGNSLDEAVTKTADLLSEEVAVTVHSFSDGESDNADYPKRMAYYFQFMSYIVLSVLITILSTVILTMNKKEVRSRTNCSCMTVTSQTAQIILGSAVIVAVIWVIFIAAAFIMNGGTFTEKCLLAVFNSFVFTIVSAGIAILIAALAPKSDSISVISNIVSLGMSFLCGVFVDQNLLGEDVLSAARFLPAYWYVRANNMLSGLSDEVFNINSFMSFVGIEAIFAAALFAIIILIYKAKHNAQ